MRIAVPYQNGEIFPHFGRTEQFKLYDTAEGRIVSETVMNTNGSGHGALAGLLAALRVEVLVCGGIGVGAQMALAQAGIRVCGGVSGSADAAARAMAEGTLRFRSEPTCSHHGEERGGHPCGEHGCGHTCG